VTADWLPPLVGGFGLGSLLTSVVQTWMQRSTDAKAKAFTEKRDCYLGLIEAIRDHKLNSNDKNLMQYAYWKARAVLVGSPEVFRLAQLVSDTKGGTKENNKAHGDLLTEMRKDLGVDTRRLE
jgi:hypothetical protein